MVTGVDLVKLQIAVARGEKLPFRQEDLSPRGHAIECRVYAEDPDAGFLPSPGRISTLRVPGGPGIRDDSGVEEDDEVPSYYDPLISKLVAWGEDRPAAIDRMRRALHEYRIFGIQTTLAFFERVLRHPDFVAGQIDTGFVERLARDARGHGHGEDERPWPVALAAASIRLLEQRRARVVRRPASAPPSAWQRGGRWAMGAGGDPRAAVDGRACRVTVTGSQGGHAPSTRPRRMAPSGAPISAAVDGRSYTVGLEPRSGGYRVNVGSDAFVVDLAEATRAAAPAAVRVPQGPARLTAPMPGRIVRVLVEPGQAVESGQGLVVMEAMKMENSCAPRGPGGGGARGRAADGGDRRPSRGGGVSRRS
jgi:acetyl/propionyl-CoA carboxylase alpha subunit